MSFFLASVFNNAATRGHHSKSNNYPKEESESCVLRNPSSGSRVFQMSLSLEPISSSLGFWGIPQQDWIYIPSRVFRIYCMIFLMLDMHEELPNRGIQEVSESHAWITSAGCFRHEETAASLWLIPDVQVPHLKSWAKPPSKENSFLATCIANFILLVTTQS